MDNIYAKINSMELLAKEYYVKGVPENEIQEQDVTQLFLNEIPYMLDGEILSMGIIGNVGSSKSTLMMLLVWWIKRKYFGKEMELADICADQYEFGRKMTDQSIHDTIMGIDEYGALEETGYNATIEMKYLEQFSDLQAQRKINRISCAPRKVFDVNCRVILQIISKDPTRFLSHCRVYYKIETPNYTQIQLIGRASFNVKPIMFEEDGWKRLKKDFPKEWKEYKRIMKGKNMEMVEIYGRNNEEGFFKYILNTLELPEFGEDGYGKYQRPIYHRYRLRKFKKFELLNKEGVMQMREMTFAELYLDIFKSLQPLLKVMKVSKDIIEGKANVHLKKRKMPATLFTMEILKTRVNSLVTQMVAIETMKLKLIKVKTKDQRDILQDAIRETAKTLQEEVNSLNRLCEINKEYEGI